MSRLGLFDAYGVEIEHMIVDRDSLEVSPVCDRLIEAVAGSPVSEVERGEMAWSNELVLHVLEFKTNGPAPTLAGLGARFHAEALAAVEALGPLGCTLVGGGVHPWMDPAEETRLWPHEYTDVYRTFDRIFGCSGHGWSNLQSTHLNLPFDGDHEFRRLHAAIRVVLPLIPALAASSPFLDGKVQPALDARLEAYRLNAIRVPEVAGMVVPEPVRSEEEYRELVLEPLYAALAPHDPEGVLRHEWANARGAIARFERGAIEIRVIDTQECPTADLALVSMITAVVRALCQERWCSVSALDALSTERLADLFREAVRRGGDAFVTDTPVLRALGVGKSEARALDVWRNLADRLAPDMVPDEYGRTLEALVSHGPLAGRLLTAHRPEKESGGGRSLPAILDELTDCLLDDRLFGV